MPEANVLDTKKLINFFCGTILKCDIVSAIALRNTWQSPHRGGGWMTLYCSAWHVYLYVCTTLSPVQCLAESSQGRWVDDFVLQCMACLSVCLYHTVTRTMSEQVTRLK